MARIHCRRSIDSNASARQPGSFLNGLRLRSTSRSAIAALSSRSEKKCRFRRRARIHLSPPRALAARINFESVTFGALRIGSLHERIASAGARDGALGIIDDDASGDRSEPLKGASVTVQPRHHRLIEHELTYWCREKLSARDIAMILGTSLEYDVAEIVDPRPPYRREAVERSAGTDSIVTAVLSSPSPDTR
jgi:hypothetical protein